MKAIFLSLSILLSSIVFAQSKTDEAEVRKLVDELLMAFNSHDFTTLKNNSTDSVSWVNIVGMWWKGRDQVVGAHYAVFNKIFNGVKFAKKEVSIRPVSDAVMIVHAVQHVGAFYPPDGIDHGTNKQEAIDNNLLLVYVKEKGQWLLSAAHNTEVQPNTVPPKL